MDQAEESEEEIEDGVEAVGSQQQQRKAKKGRKAAVTGPNPCLGCQKNCTKAQHSVRCTLCELWCHKNCAGLSEEAFRGLDIQQKETGTAFWACRSCLGYAKKVNNQFKRIEERIDNTDQSVDENKKSIEETQKLAQETAAEVKTLTNRLDRMANEMEEKLDTELREREVRKQNLIIHGLAEVGDNVSGNKERMEADKRNCEAVFRALGARTGANNMRFCRRIGERGQASRPLVVGLNSEGDKNFILSKAKNLLNTEFHEVAIVPDLTKRQRAGEAKLKEEADRRNKQLTQQDIYNNMKWLVVGRRGEKRLIKGIEREFTPAPPPATYSQVPQPSQRNTGRRLQTNVERPGQVQAAGPQYDQFSQQAQAPFPQLSRQSQVQVAEPQIVQQFNHQQQWPPLQIGTSQVQAAGPLAYHQLHQHGGRNQVLASGLPPEQHQPQYRGYDRPRQENFTAREMDQQMRYGQQQGQERGIYEPPPHQRGRLNSKRPLDHEEGQEDGSQQIRRQRQ